MEINTRYLEQEFFATIDGVDIKSLSKSEFLEIKKAVENFYGINVEKVRTLIMPAKTSVKYTKAGMVEGGKGAYKKAIVEVRSGETIDLYSNI